MSSRRIRAGHSFSLLSLSPFLSLSSLNLSCVTREESVSAVCDLCLFRLLLVVVVCLLACLLSFFLLVDACMQDLKTQNIFLTAQGIVKCMSEEGEGGGEEEEDQSRRGSGD